MEFLRPPCSKINLMKKASLLPTWRWFGPRDSISLEEVRQSGAEGIVTALHHIPHGQIWPGGEIEKRLAELAQAGFPWSVVESVPVHESIKTRTGNFRQFLSNYQETLRHLASFGIRTVCYNFMPVLDWTRTQLDYELPDHSRALRFDQAELAVFDLHLLKREGAEKDHPPAILQKAADLFRNQAPGWLDRLQANILMGVPGEASSTLEDLRESIRIYQDIGHEGLREHLALFLEAVVPVCEELGIQMVIHPDDPPFDILGLPRIASNLEDLQLITQRVPSPCNGICFCSGSLGAGRQNDLPKILETLGDRVHFVHFRNVRKFPDGSFHETPHLSGDADLFRLMEILQKIQEKRSEPIPFRPDHGLQMLDDLGKTTFPGYSLIGRMKGLAELRGLALGISGSNRGSSAL